MKKSIFAFLLLGVMSARAQVPQENLDKYWTYRDVLHKNFVKVGRLPGESIPASARSIGFAYSGVPVNSEGEKPSRIYYQDATIYLGHYLAVLGTECKLLLNSYSQVSETTEQQEILNQLEATKTELFYALSAVNRLDLNAEEYLSEGVDSKSPDDLNGLLLRDDVPLNFHQNFIEDFSQIFDRNFDFILTHSDYKPCEMWTYTDDEGVDHVAGVQHDYNDGNVMSNEMNAYLHLSPRL